MLGLWIEQTEGAAFWLRVMTELKSRGVEDILIALIDGLAGFPEAITAVFPQTQIHHCMVHLVRGSLSYVSWKNRQAVATELRAIYRAPTEAAAHAALEDFAGSPWGDQYPPIATMWRRHWEYIRPVFAYPPLIRRLLYTTNAIESLHMQLRKIIKTRGHFPTDEAASKLLYLALRNIIAKWKTRRPRVESGPSPPRRPVRRTLHRSPVARRFTHKISDTSDPTFTVRNAQPNELRVIATLLSELQHPVDAASIHSRLAAVLADHGAVLLAVDEHDHPLGLMSLSRHVAIHAPGPIAYITALVTSSTARRRGVGQLLVAAAKRWAAEQGCIRLSVTSAERRSNAHAFYPACGLPYTGRRFSTPIPPPE